MPVISFRSRGDAALFGGHITAQMKAKLEISPTRSLADFWPTVTLAAKNLATEITNHNVKQHDLQGESLIGHEHVQNNASVRSMLVERGIKPEALPR
jgi:DNA-damage-inducible protein D